MLAVGVGGGMHYARDQQDNLVNVNIIQNFLLYSNSIYYKFYQPLIFKSWRWVGTVGLGNIALIDFLDASHRVDLAGLRLLLLQDARPTQAQDRLRRFS